MKDRLIAVMLTVIMVLNGLDVLTDISLGIPLWHILEETVIVLISGIGAAYLFFDIRRRSRKLENLSDNLLEADRKIRNLAEEIKVARKNYSEVIQLQFNDWKLTAGEQQVALLLLKGLSFKEIAAARNTKDKTVRQQASSIYAKTELEGRHEFSAWFMEDFLTDGVGNEYSHSAS